MQWQKILNYSGRFLSLIIQVMKMKKIPESFYFCDNEKDGNDCAKIVVKNIKQATAPSLWAFEINNEKLPEDMIIVCQYFNTIYS